MKVFALSPEHCVIHCTFSRPPILTSSAVGMTMKNEIYEELGQWFIRLHMCLSHFAVSRNPYSYYSLTNYQLFRAYSLVRKYNVARQIGILAGKVACRLLYYLPTINSHYASIIIDRLTYYQYFCCWSCAVWCRLCCRTEGNYSWIQYLIKF